MFSDDFDPWNIIAIPLFYAIMVGYVIRDFISDRLKSNTHLE